MSECCGRTGNIWRMKSMWRILSMRWWRLGFLLPRIRGISWWCSPARAKWKPKSSWTYSSRPERRGTRCLPPCSTPWEPTTDTRPWWRNWTSPPLVTWWWYTHWWKTVTYFLVNVWLLYLLKWQIRVYIYLIEPFYGRSFLLIHFYVRISNACKFYFFETFIWGGGIWCNLICILTSALYLKQGFKPQLSKTIWSNYVSSQVTWLL